MNLLIIRPAALGDTLMLMPSLRALQEKVQTTLVGRRPGIDFLAPYVDHVRDYEAQGWHALFMEQEETVLPLFQSAIDLAVLFHADPNGSVAARLRTLLLGAPVNVFPGFPAVDEEIHVSRYLAGCLEASGCPINAENAFEEALRSPLLNPGDVGEGFHPLPPDNGDSANLGEGFSPSRSGKGTRRVVFHPGSGGTKKNHPPEFWLDFMHHFSESSSLSLMFLLGPAEEGLLAFFHDHLQRNETEILFCPEKEALISLLAQSRLFVGHDSGITHLAAMLGTPTLAFFRSTSVIQWRPLGPKVRIIEGDHCGPDMLEQALVLASELLKTDD